MTNLDSPLEQSIDPLVNSSDMPVAPRLQIAVLETIEKAFKDNYSGTVGLGNDIEDIVAIANTKH